SSLNTTAAFPLGASGDTTWLNLITIGCWAKAAPASAKLVAAKAAAAIAAKSLLRIFPPTFSAGRNACCPVRPFLRPFPAALKLICTTATSCACAHLVATTPGARAFCPPFLDRKRAGGTPALRAHPSRYLPSRHAQFGQ